MSGSEGLGAHVQEVLISCKSNAGGEAQVGLL